MVRRVSDEVGSNVQMISSKIWFLLPMPFIGCLLHPKVAFHHGLNNILPCLCYVYHEEKTSPPVSDPPPPPTPGKSGSLISQKSSGKCFGVSCFKVITVARKKDVFLPRGMKKDVKCREKEKQIATTFQQISFCVFTARIVVNELKYLPNKEILKQVFIF